jgi:hypothetical protein
MRAVEQWRLIQAGLDPHWDEVSLAFNVEDPAAMDASAAVLGPLGAGRSRGVLRFSVSRRGGAPEKLANLLGRLDAKRLWGTLELVDVAIAEPLEDAPETEEAHDVELAPAVTAASLVEAWDAAVSQLPPGWSDVLCELEVDSSDFLAQAALLGAPLNPTRVPSSTGLRFRASNGVGYGTASAMVRRCFERMDDAGITGRLRVLLGVADVENVGTQGPVWRVAGRSV